MTPDTSSSFRRVVVHPITVFLVVGCVVWLVMHLTGARAPQAVLGGLVWASAATWWHVRGRAARPSRARYVAVERTRLDRVGPPIALALVLGYMVWFGIVPQLRSLGADGAVITFEVDFDDAAAASDIGGLLAGDLDVPVPLRQVAMCRAGTDWLSDIVLNTQVVVGTRRELVRAAELVSDRQFDGKLVHDIERRLWAGVAADRIATDLAGEWDATAIERYLAARAQGPSAAAAERFVAYAAATDAFGGGLLRIVDSERLDHAAVRGFAGSAGSPQAWLAGSAEPPTTMQPGTCRAVLHEIDRRSG